MTQHTAHPCTAWFCAAHHRWKTFLSIAPLSSFSESQLATVLKAAHNLGRRILAHTSAHLSLARARQDTIVSHGPMAAATVT